MYLKGAIEKTGTGTEDMVKQCRSWGLADPEFTDGPDFRIVIRRQGKNLMGVHSGDSVPANVPAKGEPEAFLASVGEHPGLGTAFHAAKLGKTRRTIKRYAAALSDFVEFRGGTQKGGYYLKLKI